MTGLNKFSDKDRRRQRRSFQRNHIAHDLGSPKYHQRIKERKRVDDDEGYYFVEPYLDDEDVE